MGDAATTEDAWQRTRRFIAGYFSGCALVLVRSCIHQMPSLRSIDNSKCSHAPLSIGYHR
eukprot:m.82334 g.82334  ORF g.82334 m.82334 type:complete len:60 (+) comp12685_c0_seq1:225-404(+)